MFATRSNWAKIILAITLSADVSACSSGDHNRPSVKARDNEVWFGLPLGGPSPVKSDEVSFVQFDPPKPWHLGSYNTDDKGLISVISVSDDALLPAPPDSGRPETRIKSEEQLKRERRTVLELLYKRFGEPDTDLPINSLDSYLSLTWRYHPELGRCLIPISDAPSSSLGHIHFGDTPRGFAVTVMSLQLNGLRERIKGCSTNRND